MQHTVLGHLERYSAVCMLARYSKRSLLLMFCKECHRNKLIVCLVGSFEMNLWLTKNLAIIVASIIEDETLDWLVDRAQVLHPAAARDIMALRWSKASLKHTCEPGAARRLAQFSG